MEATVTIEYPDKELAKAVANAVSPDNFKTPPQLTVRTFHQGCKVTTTILCEGKQATFIATIDDLLFSATTAEKVLKSINKI